MRCSPESQADTGAGRAPDAVARTFARYAAATDQRRAPPHAEAMRRPTGSKYLVPAGTAAVARGGHRRPFPKPQVVKGIRLPEDDRSALGIRRLVPPRDSWIAGVAGGKYDLDHVDLTGNQGNRRRKVEVREAARPKREREQETRSDDRPVDRGVADVDEQVCRAGDVSVPHHQFDRVQGGGCRDELLADRGQEANAPARLDRRQGLLVHAERMATSGGREREERERKDAEQPPRPCCHRKLPSLLSVTVCTVVLLG